MVQAAESYADIMDRVAVQRARLYTGTSPEERWGDDAARRFRLDPHRELSGNLVAIASFIQPDDVLLDVGGGAGRMGLPLALRCREVINVDPSQAMLRQFEECAAEAGISNARAIHCNWLEAEGITADVVFSAHVVYFVREIATFVQKLEQAARRRAIIDVSSVPNPNRSARLFRLVYDEEQAPVPSYRELLAVLWDLGILPDLKVLPGPSRVGVTYASREEAVARSVEGSWCAPGDRERAAGVIDDNFTQLFEATDGVFRPKWVPNSRELLITWETGPA